MTNNLPEEMLLDFDGWLGRADAEARAGIQSLLNVAPDPAAEKRRIASIATIAADTGLDLAAVNERWNDFRAGYAETQGGDWLAVKDDDAGFHGALVKRAAQRRDERFLLQGADDERAADAAQRWDESLVNRAREAAYGKRSYGDALTEWQATARGKSGYNESHASAYAKIASAEHGRMALALAKIEPLAKQAYGQIARARGVEKGEGDIAPFALMRGLSAEEKQLAFRLMSDYAGTGPDKADWTGFFQATGEATGRGFENLALGGGAAELRSRLLRMKFAEGQAVAANDAKGEVYRLLLEHKMAQSASGAGLFAGGSGFIPPKVETRKLTAGEAADWNRQLGVAIEDLDTGEALRKFGQSTIDPTNKSGSWARRKLWLPAADSAAVMTSLALPGGWAPALELGARSYQNDEYQRLRDLGMEAGEADRLALVTGSAAAALDKLQVGLLAKGLPNTGRVLEKFALSGSAAARLGVNFSGTLAAETMIELAQDHVIPALVQDNLVSDPRFDVKWGDVWREAAQAAPDIALGMVLLSGAGGVAQTARQSAFTRELAGSSAAMRARGYSVEQIGEIQAAPESERGALLAKYLPAKAPEGAERTALVAEAVTMAQAERDAFAEKQRVEAAASAEAGDYAISMTRSGSGWWVTQGEKSVRVDSAEAAVRIRDDLKQAANQREAESFVALVDQWADAAPEGAERSTTVTGDFVTSDGTTVKRQRFDAVEATTVEVTPAYLAALREEAQMDAVLTGNEAIDVAINGTNDVFTERVSDGARRLVQRLEINRGDSAVLTFLHEKVEADFQAGVVSGAMSVAEARRAIAAMGGAFDPAQARNAEEKVFRERIQRIASNDATETEIRETLSELAVADFIGKRRDGSAMPAGAITSALDAAIRENTNAQTVRELGMVRAFIQAVRTYFRALFGTAAALKKARREGTAEDFDALIAKITGTDEQVKFDREAAAEAEAIASAAGLKYEAPSAEAEAGGVAFSLKRGASLNSQKKAIPATDEKMPRFLTRGEPAKVNARVVNWMRDHPLATAPDGRQILIANPEKGSLEKRAEHLTSSHEKGDIYKKRPREFRVEKAASISAILSTIEGAQVKAISSDRAIIYLRRYAGGELHAVFTDEDGRMTGHGEVSGGLVTQYTLDSTEGIEGARVVQDWTTASPASPVNPAKDEGADRVTTPEPQPESQRGDTPNSPAQGYLDADGGIVNDGPSSFRLAAGSRLAAMQNRLDAALARDPEARRRIGRRAAAKLQELEFNAETLRFTPRGDEIRPLVEKRTVRELDKEQAFREAARTEELTEEAMARLGPETLAALAQGVEKLNEHPLIVGLLHEHAGRLVSKTEMKRQGRSVSGEYDGAPWLPPSWYGGSITPDEAAGLLHNAGLLRDGLPDALWKALGDVIESHRKQSANFKEASKAVAEVERQARNKAKEEAAEWRAAEDEKQAKDWSPRAALVRDLRALDALLSVLPPEIRGKVGGFVKLATLAGDAARLKEINRRIKKLSGLLETHLQKESVAALEKLIEKAEPKGGPGERPSGKIGVEGHRVFAEVERVWRMTKEQAAAEKATLEKAIEDEAVTPTSSEAMIDLLERQQLAEMFAHFAGKSAAEMDKAVTWLDAVYKTGRNAWRESEAARLAEIADLRAETIAALGAPTLAKRQEQKAAETKVAKLLENGSLDLLSFVQVLESLLAPGHPLVVRWNRAARRATAAKTDAILAAHARFDAASATALPGKTRLDVQRRLWRMASEQTISIPKREGVLVKDVEAAREIVERWRDSSVKVESRGTWLAATSLAGAVGGHIKNGTLRISSASVFLPGKGEGGKLYRALIYEALRRGLAVESDTTVERSAVHVYEALSRRGFVVQKNLLANEVGGDVDALFAPRDEAVFKVLSAPEYADPAALGFTKAEADELISQLDDPANARKKNLSVTRSDPGVVTPAKITESEAIALTMLARQSQYAENLARHGYDAEALEAAEAELSAEARALREFFTREYREGYEPLARLFREMFGIDLPQIKDYSPASFAHAGKERDVDPFGGGLIDSGGFRAGFLKERKAHLAEPNLESAFSVWRGHVAQMEHWKAFAPLVRELRGVLGSVEVKQAIRSAKGEEMAGALSRWIEALENNGLRERSLSRALDGWFRNVARKQAVLTLAWKGGTLLKQSLATISSAARIPPGAWLRGFSRVLRGKVDVKAIRDSALIQRRIASGYSPEVRAAMASLFNGEPTQFRRFVERGMEFIGETDGFFTAISAAIAYDYHLSEGTKAGLSAKAAQAQAMVETEDIVARTAQPAEMVDRSLLELGMSPLERLGFMFASEARKSTALVISAAQQFKASKITGAQAAQVLAVMWLANGLGSALIGAAWRDSQDDDDDAWLDWEHWNPLDLATQALLGPLSGVPLLNGLASAVMGFTGSSPFKGVGSAGAAAKNLFDGDKAEPIEKTLGRTVAVLNGAAMLAGKVEALAVGANIAKQVFALVDNFTPDADAEALKKERAARRRERAELED